VPVALATSTPRATMERKLAAPAAQGLRSIFQARRPWPRPGPAPSRKRPPLRLCLAALHWPTPFLSLFQPALVV
jgi:hypothetical protein